jgi:hypothetical protein
MKKKSLLLTAVATLGLTAATMAQNVPNYVPTNGLVGWWPFNGNANDESGNNNNGTVNGATLTSDRFGNANKAYYFNGNSLVTILNNATLNFQSSNGLSVSIWAERTSASLLGHLFGKRNGCPGNTFQYQMGFNLSGSGIGWGGMNGASNSYVEYLPQFSINQWINFIGTFNGNQWKIYQNGILMDSLIAALQPAVSNDLLIGGSGTCQKFTGNLDDIGIWNRPLTQQEITDLYNGNICYQTITVTDTLLINMGITGFNPVTYNNTIRIFPNPTNDHITINYGNFVSLNGYQLKIENSLGQQVFQTNITQQSDYLNLTNWGGNGLYFVRIIDPQGNTIDIRKIVLQ